MKFLFKVKFEGFTENTCYYYVHACDKPAVTLNHTDVNYYNFRTRVLTHVTFNPINMTILDEIGNSLNEFFVLYMAQISGQGSGNWGTNNLKASSSLPYETGKYYDGHSLLKSITIMQIFGNGTMMNEFKLINPRIETFTFDGLSMEENGVSMANLSISYDSLVCTTNDLQDESPNSFYTWGATDLLRGGGTSGIANNGATSLADNQVKPSGSSGGVLSTIISRFNGSRLAKTVTDAIRAAPARIVPNWLSKPIGPISDTITGDTIRSTTSITTRDINQSLANIDLTPASLPIPNFTDKNGVGDY
jgi:hypothetical protein